MLGVIDEITLRLGLSNAVGKLDGMAVSVRDGTVLGTDDGVILETSVGVVEGA